MKKRLLLILFLIFSVIVTGFSYTGFFVGNFDAEIDTGIIVIDNEFHNIGSTTQFLYMNDTELESVENMILDNGIDSKVYFLDKINLTEDVYDGVIDISGNVKILHNYISIDSSNIKSLNKPAIIYLYNLGFTNPVVVKNGIICPNSVCEALSYIGGTLIFRVDSFSHYTVIEDPDIDSGGSSEGGAGGSSGSSGGASDGIVKVIYETIIKSPPSKDFFPIDEEYLELSATQGSNVSGIFNVANLYNGTIVIEVSSSESLKDFIKIKETHVVLEKDEVREFILDFNVLENKKPGIYSGSIYLEMGGIVKRIDILLEVVSETSLFDISIDVDPNIKAGSPIYSDIYVLNLGSAEGIYADLYYAIKDFSGNTIVFKEDRIYLDREAVFRKSLEFSKFVTGERYVFYAEIKYDNTSAFGYDSFSINDNTIYRNIMMILSIALFFIAMWLVFERKIPTKKSKKKK